jgi:hypothetical protein
MIWRQQRPRSTGWQIIQTAASGLKPQLPGEPIQCFRIKRTDNRVLVDLTGLRLDQEKPGLCNLGEVPEWAAAALKDQYFWVNDSPTTLHPSLCAIFRGRVLYWTETLAKGQLVVPRPATLSGGFEYVTDAPFPRL